VTVQEGEIRRRGRSLPGFAILVGLIAASVAFLVIYPLARLLYSVFFSTGEFSTRGIGAAFTDPALGPALVNTAILIGVAGGGAVLVGSILAWLNERTDAHMGWAADVLPIIPLLVPAVAGAVGWVFLLAPRAGFLNFLFRTLTHPDEHGAGSGPLNVYTLLGMIFVTGIYTVPFVYLIISAALRNLDPALEEASRMSGAGTLRTLYRVTLPAVRPAIATASVMVLITAIALFSVPVVIGVPARVDVLSVVIFRVLYAANPPRIGEAVALSTLMLLAVQVAVLLEYAITRRGRHATVGGRAHSQSINRLGLWRWPVRAVMVLYLACATVLPVLALVLVSLQAFWTPQIAWNKLSFRNYINLFDIQSALRQAFVDSLMLGAVTATVLMVVAALIAFFIQTAPGPVARLVNGITTLPSSLPHTVVAIGFLVTFGVGEHSLSGSLFLLFIAYVVLMLPQASRSAGAALSQLGRDVWEASLMAGAGPMRTFVRVLLPLMLAGLVAGWVVVFVQSLSEISAGVFLSGSTNPVVGPVILDVWQNSGTYTLLAAVTVLVTILQTTVVLAVLAFTRNASRYRIAA
jgi:iron(III) transport system permease protein